MKIDNGTRQHLQIEGVMDGMAGVVGCYVAFRPNRYLSRPEDARTGILDGNPVLLSPPLRDAAGTMWTSRFQPLT